MYHRIHTNKGKVGLEKAFVVRKPGICQLLILGFTHEEIYEIKNQTSYHHHFKIKAVPVTSQMKRNLKKNKGSIDYLI